MSNLTPWFDGKKFKPARKGVYMLMSVEGGRAGYQFWNGVAWGAWCETPFRAYIQKNSLAWGFYQNDNWRGLAKPAK